MFRRVSASPLCRLVKSVNSIPVRPMLTSSMSKQGPKQSNPLSSFSRAMSIVRPDVIDFADFPIGKTAPPPFSRRLRTDFDDKFDEPITLRRGDEYYNSRKKEALRQFGIVWLGLSMLFITYTLIELKKTARYQFLLFNKQIVYRCLYDAVEIAVDQGVLPGYLLTTNFGSSETEGNSAADLRLLLTDALRLGKETDDLDNMFRTVAKRSSNKQFFPYPKMEMYAGEMGLERARRKTGGSLDSVAVEDAVAYLAMHSYLQAVPEFIHTMEVVANGAGAPDAMLSSSARRDEGAAAIHSAQAMVDALKAFESDARAWLRTSPTAGRLQAAGVAAELDALAEAHRHRSAHRLSGHQPGDSHSHSHSPDAGAQDQFSYSHGHGDYRQSESSSHFGLGGESQWTAGK